MRKVLLIGALLGSALAQTETRIPPEPLLILGVAQDASSTQSSSVIVVRGRYSAHVRVVDSATAELRREFWLPPEVLPNSPVSISSDGHWMAVLLSPEPDSTNPRVSILDMSASSKVDAPLSSSKIISNGGLQGSNSLALNNDGSRLAIGNKNGYVQLWDTSSLERITSIQSESKLDASQMIFSPDGNLFAPIFRSQIKTRIFDSKTGSLKITLGGVGLGIFSPDSKGFLASRGRFVSLTDGKEQVQPPYLKNTNGIIGFSIDGTRILVKRLVTDAQGREWLELRDASGHTLGAVTRIADGYPEFLSPDGTSLVGGDGQGGVRILPIAPK